MRPATLMLALWGMLFLPLSTTVAADQAAKSPGFSGRLSAGTGFMASTDQLKTTDENKQVDSLSGDADWYDTVMPLALFKFQYTFSDSGRELYIGTPAEFNGPPGLSLGFIQPLSSGGSLDLSVFANPFSEVWQDPYETNANRKETDKSVFGARIEYNNITGSPFKLAYSISRENVDDDVIGDRFEDLERDGFTHSAEVEYGFKLGRSFSLVPGFELSIGDIDGDANAYIGYNFSLGLRKFSERNRFMLKASVGWDDYDERHSVFDKTRNDTNYSVFGMLTRSMLFGRDFLFGTLMAGYRYRDSNIGFLEAQTFITGAMIGVEF